MSIVSKCPKCEEVVTIPDGVGPQSAVRCPLCEAEYPLSEALAAAPPALIPVDRAAAQGLVPDSNAMLKSDLVTEPFHVPDVDAASTPAAAKPHSGRPAAETPALDAWKKVDEPPEIDLGHDAVALEGAVAGDFAAFAEEEAEGEGKTAAAGVSRPRGKRKKHKSIVRVILEPVVGGFAGLALAYYGLNYFGGERFDFLEIYLPGVAHTCKHKPQWVKWPEKKPDNRVQEPASERADGPQTPRDEMTGDATPVVGPQPEPQPQSLPDGYIGVLSPPSFTSDELGKALKAANEAISGDHATGEMTAEAYRTFCRLGHVLTFVKGKAADTRLDDRKQAVKTIRERLAEDPGRVNEIGRLAAGRIETAGGPKGGILLAGAAGQTQEQGGLYATTIRLAGHPGPVVVMSDRPLPFEDKTTVLVLGSVVTDPAENLAGYKGTKPFLVWVGTAVTAP